MEDAIWWCASVDSPSAGCVVELLVQHTPTLQLRIMTAAATGRSKKKEIRKHENKYGATLTITTATRRIQIPSRPKQVAMGWISWAHPIEEVSLAFVAYYMFGDEMFGNEMSSEERTIKQNLFEDQQQQLEANIERLSIVLGRGFFERRRRESVGNKEAYRQPLSSH